MQILDQLETAWSFLGDDHNYYVVFDSDCGDPPVAVPMELGPFAVCEPCVDIPFWLTAIAG